MADQAFVITADQVFDGYTVLPRHAVVIRDDRIVAVVPAEQAGSTGRRIEIAGTVLPGFIDLHGHVLLDRT
ncbi:MAG TPA: amidohydrolase family protein, partial [Nonomuraea sp.]|nr:amidohydrolase family protein [Nonomuraea sp.]